MPPATTPEKIRDAARSRAAILDAAEALFSERGFGGASLQEIGTAAGLSRATPSYFFGSKEQLYVAVLERVFGEREAATEDSFAAVVAWARGDDRVTLEQALTQAVEGYMTFLLARPSFVRLLSWEGLSGGERLRGVPRSSRAIQTAFETLRAAPRRRGLRSFEVDDAVLLFVSLTFSPLAQSGTLMVSLGRDLREPAMRRRHVELVTSQLHALVGPRADR
jgi:TetR/AcrR family transcriptional regulator